MYDFHNDGGWGMGLGMWVIWLVIVVAFILIVKLVVDHSGTRSSRQDETAVEILQKRFARGEIDADEYERRKKELEQ